MKYIFIQNSIPDNDLFSSVEEYIRNYRGPDDEDNYSQLVSGTSLEYRFPFRQNQHMWKLIRDNNQPENLLTIIPKNANNFKYDYSYNININAMLKYCDEEKHPTIAGSSFYGIVDFNEEKAKNPFQYMNFLTKNDKGQLYNPLSQTVFYNNQEIETDYSKHQNLSLFPISMFKLGNLPIYIMVLNNSLISNKVLFVNKSKDFTIFAENTEPLKTRIFNLDFENIQFRNDNVVITEGPFKLDFFSNKSWETFNGVHKSGSEIGLIGHSLDISKDVLINTNMKFSWENNKLNITPISNFNYLNIKISTGAFWETCTKEFDWSFTVLRSN
jgi:hypothetical protein